MLDASCIIWRSKTGQTKACTVLLAGERMGDKGSMDPVFAGSNSGRNTMRIQTWNWDVDQHERRILTCGFCVLP
jgi:hypothetical protein